MKKIYLIRHGETSWNQLFRYQGRRNIALNDAGRRQAELLAGRIHVERVEAIFSSPLLRARDTALLISEKLGIPPYFDDGLAEIDFGDWEGFTYEELTMKQRLIVDRWFHNPENVQIPGGEDYHSFKRRVLECYSNILSNNGGNIIIVTHAGVIKLIVSAVLAIPAEKLSKLILAPTSLTVLVYDGLNTGYLELFNETCHLR